MPSARAQLVKWGNSRAVRIPKAVLQQACFREDEELNLTAAEGCITIRPRRNKLTLESLVRRITPENRYDELDWGPAVGKEIW
jgi:antitoxin MazE